MSLVHVEFEWDDSHGTCYECGLPAAFALPEAYGEAAGREFWRAIGTDPAMVDAKHKRCSRCAANDAAEGERVTRLARWSKARAS